MTVKSEPLLLARKGRVDKNRQSRTGWLWKFIVVTIARYNYTSNKKTDTILHVLQELEIITQVGRIILT